MAPSPPLACAVQTNFNLTPEAIHKIFAVRPAVRDAYRANVPARMTTQEFWDRYCRAIITKRMRHGAPPATEQEAADLAMFAGDEAAAAEEARRKVRRRRGALGAGVCAQVSVCEGGVTCGGRRMRW